MSKYAGRALDAETCRRLHVWAINAEREVLEKHAKECGPACRWIGHYQSWEVLNGAEAPRKQEESTDA